MATFQVLESRDRRGSKRHLSLVANQQQAAPEAMAGADALPALLGSEDLLLLAHRLVPFGFIPHGATIVDSRLSPVEPELSAQIGAQVIGTLRDVPQWSDVRKTIESHLGPYYVLSIELRDKELGGRVQLAQEGIVTSTSIESVKRLSPLLDDLMPG